MEQQDIKICIKCKTERTIDNFVRDKNRDDGRYPVCKQCRSAYYQSKRSEICKQMREYREAHKEELLDRARKYSNRRFFYIRASNLLTRDSGFNKNGSKESRGILKETCRQISLLWKKQRGICPLSGRRLNRENCQLDHIIPMVRGGGREITNLRWVHRDVNYAKRDLLDTEFISLCYEVTKIVYKEAGITL